MNEIREIRLTKTHFIVITDTIPLKLKYKNIQEKLVIDISLMNLIQATKIAIMCSTYCFIKDFKKKLCWIVKDEEIKNAISILRLRNIEQIILDESEKLYTELAS